MLAVFIALWQSRNIVNPLRSAVDQAQQVARGDLTVALESSSRDEVGELLYALSTMTQSLARIVGKVRSGTDSIATASSEIKSGNLDLSTRTEQQAASLEATASSCEAACHRQVGLRHWQHASDGNCRPMGVI